MSNFSIEEYVCAKVADHPKLELLEQRDTHAGKDGHVFVICRVDNKTQSAAFTTSGIEGVGNDKNIKSLIDARFEKLMEVLGVT